MKIIHRIVFLWRWYVEYRIWKLFHWKESHYRHIDRLDG